MGPSYDDRTPQEEPTREPLVDLGVKPPQPGEPSPGSLLRRKRLSDMESEGDEARPQPPISRQRRRSLADSEAGSEEPPSESGSSPEPPRPCLVDIAATPEEHEPQIRAGRPRATITPSFEDLPGLQNILDPPRAVSAVLDLGQGPIQPITSDREAQPSLAVALVAGVTTAVVAALVWALTTMTTSYRAGWLAIGMGILIGSAVRTTGRGVDKSFGCLGAAVSVLGLLLGNLLTVCALVAAQEGLSPLSVLTHICRKPGMIPAAMLAAFQPLDLLFWAVAVYAGYRLSFRRIPPAETGNSDRNN